MNNYWRTNLNCIVLAAVKHLNEDSEDKVIYNKLKVLLDSGASSSIVYKNRLPQAIAATLKHIPCGRGVGKNYI